MVNVIITLKPCLSGIAVYPEEYPKKKNKILARNSFVDSSWESYFKTPVYIGILQ